MEVGGFAIGAVALVSLVKDCTDLYSMLISAKELDKDSSSLQTKLELERNRFLMWSERLELLYQDQNELVFSNARAPHLIKQISQLIDDLLNDGRVLKDTYGLQSAESVKQPDLTVTSKRKLESASDFQLSQFFKNRRTKIKGAFSSYRSSKLDNITKKISWVIIDKEKFNKLILDLSYYNTRLDELFPGPTPASTTTVEVSEERLNRREAATAARIDAIRSRVLDTLWFRWLDDRRLNVKDAHAKTFSWVLDPDVNKENRNHLPTWLQGRSGIYWLYGKAGSGKSTLMKFLHDDERTKEYLKVWAGEQELISSSFFFYAQGQSEQKTQVGLLRSLLHQLLSRDAALTETVLPQAWTEACRRRKKKHEDLSMPSVAEMGTALKEICRMYQATKKIFFLIDGIDEYEGKDIEVADFISELGKFSNVKILVSSRPHSAFFTNFGESPNMDLPCLTEQDIASYVDDTVASHPNMRALSSMNPNAANSITKSLVKRASGVFLWVVLVCRSVIEGCDEYETASDLQARIDESPKEVEDLLRHIIETIPPSWQDEAMKVMYLVYTNQGSNCIIPIFGLYLISKQGYSSDMQSSDIKAWGPYTSEERESRCCIMEAKLRSRCRGLIEGKRPSKDDVGYQLRWPDKGEQSGLNIRHYNVNFMHRTVYDLFSQQSVFDRHFGKIIQQGFNSYSVLCNLWCQLTATFHEDRSCKKLESESSNYELDDYDSDDGKSDDYDSDSYEPDDYPDDYSDDCPDEYLDDYVPDDDKFKSCLRVDCLNNAISILRYGNRQGCQPHILLHCISRIQYVCGFFLYDEFYRRQFLHDMRCRDYYSDISVVHALAAEFALPETIRLVYESNVPLHQYLYQPLSLKSLESCQDGKTKGMGRHDCHEVYPCHQIKTQQWDINMGCPLVFHCLLKPFLYSLCSHVIHMREEVNRLRAIRFILEKENLDYMDTETLLDRFDMLHNIRGKHCDQIYKDIRMAIQSRLD